MFNRLSLKAEKFYNKYIKTAVKRPYWIYWAPVIASYRFPALSGFLYRALRNLVIYLPFVHSEYKWALLKKELLNYRINKLHIKKGLPSADHSTFIINYSEGDVVSDYKKKKKTTGYFTITNSVLNIRVEGIVRAPGTEYIYLMLNRSLFTKIKVKNKKFSMKILQTVLSTFPSKCTLSIQLENGHKLLFRKSEEALISIPSGSGTIQNIMDEGSSLSKKGGISTSKQLMINQQNNYLKLYSRLKTIFEAENGIPLFIMYGTLLGYHREGDFIVNDDDFDAAYYSTAVKPSAIKKEAAEIIIKLIRKGFSVEFNRHGRLFRISEGGTLHIDTMPLVTVKNKLLCYGGVCVDAGPEDLLPVKKGMMRNHEIHTPNDPEKILAAYYGKDWRIPNPAYTSDDAKKSKTVMKRFYEKTMFLTPYEYLKLKKRADKEKAANPGAGTVYSLALMDR
jgi:hypothetical protein